MEIYDDLQWMQHAAALSRSGMEKGCGGPFGAVVVRDNVIIGSGQNEVTSSFDPTAHAEVVAIRQACKTLKTFSLKGCKIYSSCEPCPMCLSAIYWARLDSLFFANTRQQAANIGFDDEFLYQEVPLPLERRSKPTVRLACLEAESVFEDWRNKANKIAY